jgi:Coenzyme PQQ synthesis protein D (PqqD)
MQTFAQVMTLSVQTIVDKGLWGGNQSDSVEVMSLYQVNKPDVVMESFEGELVLVHMKSGNYYSLQGSAPLIWELLERGRSVEDAGDYLVARHQGDEEEVRRSVRDLVAELVAESLMVPVTQGSASALQAPSDPVETGLPFVLPVLERYTDMQELLLLDPIHDVDQSGWPRRKEEVES